MKKISVIFQDKDAHSSLKAMGKLGVLHVEHKHIPKGEELGLLVEEHDRMLEMLNVLKQIKPRPQQEGCSHVKQMFINVSTSLAEMNEIEDRINDYQREIMKWESWGSFEPHEFLVLSKRGIHAKLFAIPESKLLDLSDDLVVETIFSANGICRVIVFSSEEINLAFDEIILPECSLDHWQAMVARDQAQLDELTYFVNDCAKHINVFEKRLHRVEERIAQQEALAGREVQEDFSVITGYCPVDQTLSFEEYAKKERWAYIINDPEDEDDVPTLIKTPKWVELINPVLKMINVMPGYHEVDTSIVFLLFFSVFFGILIGDAGYGLCFAIATGLAHWKVRKTVNDKKPFYLMYVLSFTTILWGALTATFFGQKWLAGAVDPLMPWLSDGANVQKVCFFLGALHLSLAHAWKAVIKWPSLSIGGEIGWAAWIWGMFFLVKQLILEDPMPSFAIPLLISGVVGVIFCSTPNKNIFKMIGGGLGSFLGSFINSFTDIISYIRLFAVGLATVAIADAFNDIALSVGFGNILTSIITSLILVVGHVLNIVLGAMAILVHGVRLNVLEFSNHMDVQWTGFAYKPFRKDTETP